MVSNKSQIFHTAEDVEFKFGAITQLGASHNFIVDFPFGKIIPVYERQLNGQIIPLPSFDGFAMRLGRIGLGGHIDNEFVV